MLQVKIEVDWDRSSDEDVDLESSSEATAKDDDDVVNATVDVTADIVAKSSNLSSVDKEPKMRIVNLESARGSVGLVSGNRRWVSGNKSFQAVSGSKPPAMAPPPPPRGRVKKTCKEMRHKRYKHCNSLPSRMWHPRDDLSSAWHFGGRRVWSWMHDGTNANGWIELCENGYLCTNLCSSKAGSWKRQPDSDNVLVTFGKCCHVLELQITRPDNISVKNSCDPTFIVRKRTLVNGDPLRDTRPCRTRGRLLDIK